MNMALVFCTENVGADGCAEVFTCDFVADNPGSPCGAPACLTDSESAGCAAVALEYCQIYTEDPACDEVLSGIGACTFTSDDDSNPCVNVACQSEPEGQACADIVDAYCALNADDPGCVIDDDVVSCEFNATHPGSPCASAECVGTEQSAACLAVIASYCEEYPSDPACAPGDGDTDDTNAADCMFVTDREGSPCYMGVWTDVCMNGGATCALFIENYCLLNLDDPGCICDPEIANPECTFDPLNEESPCYGGDWVAVCLVSGDGCETFIADYCTDYPEDVGCSASGGNDGGDDCPYNETVEGSPCIYPACVVDYMSAECEAYVQEYCAANDDPYCLVGL